MVSKDIEAPRFPMASSGETELRPRTRGWRIAEIVGIGHLRWMLGEAVLSIAVFLLGWQLMVQYGVINDRFIPSPLQVLATLETLLSSPFAGNTIQSDALASLILFAIAYVAGLVAGLLLAVVIEFSIFGKAVIRRLVDLVRYVPPIAWVPFAILWFGTSILAPAFVIFMGSFSPIMLNALSGLQSVPQELIEYSETTGRNRARIISDVMLPASLGQLVAGMRIGSGVGWQSLIGAELIIGTTGLGYLIEQAQQNLDPQIMVGGMVAIGILGASIDVVFALVERYTHKVGITV